MPGPARRRGPAAASRACLEGAHGLARDAWDCPAPAGAWAAATARRDGVDQQDRQTVRRSGCRAAAPGAAATAASASGGSSQGERGRPRSRAPAAAGSSSPSASSPRRTRRTVSSRVSGCGPGARRPNRARWPAIAASASTSAVRSTRSPMLASSGGRTTPKPMRGSSRMSAPAARTTASSRAPSVSVWRSRRPRRCSPRERIPSSARASWRSPVPGSTRPGGSPRGSRPSAAVQLLGGGAVPSRSRCVRGLRPAAARARRPARERLWRWARRARSSA